MLQNYQWQDYLGFFGAVITNRLYETEGVVIARAVQVELSAPQDQRIYIQVDGESTGVLPASLSVVPWTPLLCWCQSATLIVESLSRYRGYR